MSINVPAAPGLWHFWAENTETSSDVLCRITAYFHVLKPRALFFFPNHYLCSFTWDRLRIPLMHLQIYFAFPIPEFHFLPAIWTAHSSGYQGKKVSFIPSFSGFCLSLLTLRNGSLGVLGAFWNEMCGCRLLIHLKSQHFLTGENLSLFLKTSSLEKVVRNCSHP